MKRKVGRKHRCMLSCSGKKIRQNTEIHFNVYDIPIKSSFLFLCDGLNLAEWNQRNN